MGLNNDSDGCLDRFLKSAADHFGRSLFSLKKLENVFLTIAAFYSRSLLIAIADGDMTCFVIGYPTVFFVHFIDLGIFLS